MFFRQTFDVSKDAESGRTAKIRSIKPGRTGDRVIKPTIHLPTRSMSNLYSVAERLTTGDHIYWKSTAEDRESNPSVIEAIIQTSERLEIRVAGPGGGQYTLDFPESKHPNTHWHPSEGSREAHRDANHQQRRGEVYVGRGPLLSLSLAGRAEDTPVSMEHERVKEYLE